MRPLWGIAGDWVHALTQLGGLSTRPAELLAVAAVTAAAVLAIVVAGRVGRPLSTVDTRPSSAVGAALRERDRRTGVLRQTDPDSAGHRRPRAPAPNPSTA